MTSTKTDRSRAACAVVAAAATFLGCSGQNDAPLDTLEGPGESAGSGVVQGTTTGSASTGGAGSPMMMTTTGAGGSAQPMGAAGAGGAAMPMGMGGGPNDGPVDTSCKLDHAAFCDPFTTASPGGRAGDLDDAKWSFARVGFACSEDSNNVVVPTPINLCGVWQTVQPGGPESKFCTTDKTDHRWVEAFDDNHSFSYNAPRIRQPFDFADRTGIIQWEADARTSATHGWWLENWITDTPVPGPNDHDPQLVTSKEALGIELADTCGLPGSTGDGTTGAGRVGVSRVMVVHDYHIKSATYTRDGCVNTVQGELNKFQFRLSKSRIEVWASDAGTDTLRRIAAADIDLTFTRGYVHPNHVQYNAEKTGGTVTEFQAYQWARVAFDGPRLSTPRAYEIPDPLTPATTTTGVKGFHIGYGVSNDKVSDMRNGITSGVPGKLTFTGVNPVGGVSANLNFNTIFVAPGDTLRYRFNGKPWNEYHVPQNLSVSWERQGFSVPVPMSDLVAGDNTVEFGTNTKPIVQAPPGSMYIANIDLEIQVP
jgi:hypothetical protein